jgi:hypothetical protein
MKIRNKQSGQALVGAAVAFVVLMGFAGLAFDMGILRYERRLQQTAADAAALAEANDLGNGGITTTEASNAAQNNGFAGATVNLNQPCPTSVTGLTVTVNNPPQSGPHQAGTANAQDYVEVCVSTLQPTYFMTLFGVNNENVMARAVATDYSGATAGNNSYNCLITLGPPTASIEGVNLNGNVTLNAPTCGIADNGNYNTKGNSLTVSAGSFGVSGSNIIKGPGGTVTCTDGQTNCPQAGAPAVGNPMASLAAPCSPCTGGTAISINGNGNFSGTGVSYANNTYTIQPGTYSSITITGTGGGNTVVFSPGQYIIDGSGGITIPGNATISGNGVFFYFTNGATINETGNPSINLSAASSGTYQGVLFFEDPNDCNCGSGGCDNGVTSCGPGPSLGGTAGSTYNGIAYFPNDQILFFGTSGTSFGIGATIADSMALSGTPTVNLVGQAGIPGGLPPSFTVLHATLVE